MVGLYPSFLLYRFHKCFPQKPKNHVDGVLKLELAVNTTSALLWYINRIFPSYLHVCQIMNW